MTALLGGGDLSSLKNAEVAAGQPPQETRRPQIEGPRLHTFGSFEGAFGFPQIGQGGRDQELDQSRIRTHLSALPLDTW